MKNIITLSLLTISCICFAQKKTKKDFTEKELLTNKRVLDFSTEMQTSPIKTINFLKCIKNESKINRFKNLPFFTGKLPLIVDKKIKHHNDELWETIHEECKQNEIFIEL